jgi:uncharacterized protein (DUF362 family)
MKTRRDFIKAGVVATAGFSLVGVNRFFAAESTNVAPVAAAAAGPKPILAAVREGTRTAMLDKAMSALGGMEAFVKKGQTVVIKPNIGWDAPPERAANTHPELVGRVVEMCLAAGAKSVSVFDNTCDQWQRTYTNSGIEEAAKKAGAVMVNGKDETLYREMAIPGGVKLRQAKVHSLILDSDVFINMPVLKHHSGTLMTGCMKNLMGVIWDRMNWHRTDLHQCIADFVTLRKPTLNIVDAYHPMVRNGPRGKTVEDVVVMKTLLASTDIVAIDAAAAKLLDHEPANIRHIKLAADLNLGTMDLDKVDIRRFKLA